MRRKQIMIKRGIAIPANCTQFEASLLIDIDKGRKKEAKMKKIK